MNKLCDAIIKYDLYECVLLFICSLFGGTVFLTLIDCPNNNVVGISLLLVAAITLYIIYKVIKNEKKSGK